MTLRALSTQDHQFVTPPQIEIGKMITQLVTDLGEDCDVFLSLDDYNDPEDTEFCFYFAGTDLFLHFTYDGLFVELLDEDGIESEIVRAYPLDRVHEATHWLLTQAN